MAEHIDVARRFVHQLLQTRDDIVGVLLVGSAARGETTDFSDVDLRLIVENKQDARLTRDGLDIWLDGIYIDATVASKAAYSEMTQVLSNPASATDVNSGLILYDPDGFLERVQQQTQAVFMEPEWIRRRIKPLAERIPGLIDGFLEAVDAKDPFQICIHMGRIVFGFALIPLLQHGIAPSSTRNMVQLGQISEPLKQRLCELEGSIDFNPDDALAAWSIIARLSAVCETGKWGNLPDYMLKKAEWMAKNGFHREAVHATWINSSFRSNDCLQCDQSQIISEARPLLQAWLRKVNWAGEDVLEKKVTATKALWQEIEASVNNLRLD